MRAIRFALVLALAAVLTFASHAWATRIYGASNPSNQEGNATELIQLGTDLKGNDVGDTLEIKVKKKGPAVVTFSAECSVEGEPADWISIQVLVNGVAIGSSADTFDAFCAADSTTTSNDGWAMNSFSIPVNLTPGTTTIQIEVTPFGATGWWIGDTSLSVILQNK